MDWVAVGNRIRKQRETLGLTREQLAERIEVTPKFVEIWDTDNKNKAFQTFIDFENETVEIKKYDE